MAAYEPWGAQRARAFRYRRSISWPCANLDLVPDNVPPFPFELFGNCYENYLHLGEGEWLLRRVKKRMDAHMAIPRVPAPPTKRTVSGEFTIASLGVDVVSSALSFLYPHELSRVEMTAKCLKAAAPAAWTEMHRRQNREAIDGGLADCVRPLAEGESARMRVIQREGSALKVVKWLVHLFEHHDGYKALLDGEMLCIDGDALDALPEDGNIAHLLPSIGDGGDANDTNAEPATEDEVPSKNGSDGVNGDADDDDDFEANVAGPEQGDATGGGEGVCHQGVTGDTTFLKKKQEEVILEALEENAD